MVKKLILIVVAIIIVGIATYLALRPEPLPSEQAAKMNIVEASVEGTVLSRTGEALVIGATRVVRSSGGNVAMPYTRNLTLMPEASVTPALKAGDKAVFYGRDEEPFKVYRVEVISRASTTPALPTGAPVIN